MIESALTADAVKAALTGFNDQRMCRAWRNRSPVTQGRYRRLAAALGDSQLAPALYVACGQFADNSGTFDAAALLDNAWPIIASLTERYSSYLPDKALSRWQYETHHRSNT